tara:strand:- start:618 stop:1718 length:1101 start_codon:yes stop_codon:yes gene_type:complete
MMHIAFFIPDYRGGGAQNMVINLANHIAANGYKVDLLIASAAGELKHKINGHVNVVCFNKSKTSKSIPALIKYTKESQPDVMISALYHANIAALLAKIFCKTTKTKFIISERNHISTSFAHSQRFADKIMLFLMKRLYKTADKVIAISDGVLRDVQKVCNIADDKIIRIYNPVVTPDFERAIAAEIPEFGYEVDVAKLIASGRLVAQKDYPTLLKALSIAVKTHPCCLVILGQGSLEHDLKALAVTLGVDNYIYWAGFVDNPLSYMAKADVFVLSSAWEGFGNVVVEGLYCGLSVVSTDCPSGPAEILEKGRYGYLSAVGDADALARNIIEAIDKPFAAESQRSRAAAFHVRNIAENYIDAAKGVL